MRTRKVLFISWDGLSDPLGQSQIFPYLRNLSEMGHKISILSLEKTERSEHLSDISEKARQAGIHWHPLKYRTCPKGVSTLQNIFQLTYYAWKLQRKERFDLFHCRGYFPATAALINKKLTGVPFIFDMRGFWPDEKVEGGLWSLKNPIFWLAYKILKKLESHLILESEKIVSLTERGKKILGDEIAPGLAGNKVHVIPCCADLQHFSYQNFTPTDSLKLREQLGIKADATVLCYLGSLGTWYMLSEMFDYFSVYREEFTNGHFLVVTPTRDLSEAHKLIREKNIDPISVSFVHSSYGDVPKYLSAADLSISFIRATFSKQASSPTKIGEILSMGMPVISNSRVGDLDTQLGQSGAGVIVKDFSLEAYRQSLIQVRELLTRNKNEIADVANKYFSLKSGVDNYNEIYQLIG